MAIVGMHIGNVVSAELIHEAYLIGIATEYPGILTGGEASERVGFWPIELKAEECGCSQ